MPVLALRFTACLTVCALMAGAAGAEVLTITHATLIDGTGAPARPDTSVVVRDGRIALIGPSAQTANEGRVIDLKGGTLLPGLVDAHAHILTPAAAKRALYAGVTSVRVLGDSYWQAMGTRDLVRGGHIPGPEILAAGPLIRPRPGEAFYVALPEMGDFITKELHGAQNVATATRAILAHGADVIKIGVNERSGTAATDPRKPELTYEEIQAVVAEAKKAGKVVAAHAYTDAGGSAAVRAGVHSIEHGAYFSDATLQLMKQNGTYFVPTMQTLSAYSERPSLSADEIVVATRRRTNGPRICSVVRRAKALGIPIAAATDGSYGDGDDTAFLRVPQDMERMLACGFTPLEAIVAATRTGARVLQIENRTGTIAPGKEADLLAVDGNPLEQFSVLYDPLLVVSDGKVVLDRLY